MKLEDLLESPEMSRATDFGLSVDRTTLPRLLKKKTDTIEDAPGYEIFRTGSNSDGNVVMYDKMGGHIDYMIHYEAYKYPWIGRTVSQIMLWRRQGSLYTKGLTTRMFFEYLLPKYHCILSDRMQTEDGKKFWIDRMAEATTRGLRVGLAGMDQKKVIWYDPSASLYLAWLTTNNGWGDKESFQRFRYVIAEPI